MYPMSLWLKHSWPSAEYATTINELLLLHYELITILNFDVEEVTAVTAAEGEDVFGPARVRWDGHIARVSAIWAFSCLHHGNLTQT